MIGRGREDLLGLLFEDAKTYFGNFLLGGGEGGGGVGGEDGGVATNQEEEG